MRQAFMKNLNAGERTTQHINGSQSGGTAISTVGEPAGVITVKNTIFINSILKVVSFIRFIYGNCSGMKYQ